MQDDRNSLLGQSTITVHGDQVKGTIESTRKFRNIHVKGELFSQHAEHLVVGIVGHQV